MTFNIPRVVRSWTAPDLFYECILPNSIRLRTNSSFQRWSNCTNLLLIGIYGVQRRLGGLTAYRRPERPTRRFAILRLAKASRASDPLSGFQGLVPGVRSTKR